MEKKRVRTCKVCDLSGTYKGPSTSFKYDSQYFLLVFTADWAIDLSHSSEPIMYKWYLILKEKNYKKSWEYRNLVVS